MARTWTLALLIPWLVAAIPSTPPPPIQLTAEERAELAGGGIVVRMDPGSETGGGAIGVVDVAAEPDRAWNALMDLEARVAEIGGLKKVTYYVKQEDEVAARWDLKVLTVGVSFHVLYHLDRPAGWVRYSLDDSRENDLVSVEGAYQLYANEHGGTRIIYRSETDSGRNVPAWIKRWLATDSLREQLGGIRARAEQASK